ncbi:MAG: hypothetical protein IJ946_00510 [Clostridia bacterium]|nr:hypothetical protein [Clostridia bacterium]
MEYNIDTIIEKARSGNAQELMKSLKEEDVKRIKGLLQNEEACKQLLKSEQAKKLMEMLKRGGMIGG